MGPDPRDVCLVNRVIRRALGDAAATLENREVRTTLELDATAPFTGARAALEQALYTIFRALPERLGRGSTLYVRTTDRAGGDIELLWEAREASGDVGEDLPLRHLVRGGPYGDLLELALHGLETICRVRSSHDSEALPDAQGSEGASPVKRRYMFLLSSPDRVPALR